MAASTDAAWAARDSWHAPLRRSVATSWYGVARPLALSGSAGTTRVQFGFGSAFGGGAGGRALVAASTAPAPPSRASGMTMPASTTSGLRGRPARADRLRKRYGAGRWFRGAVDWRRGILASPGWGVVTSV